MSTTERNIKAESFNQWIAHAMSDAECEKREQWLKRVRAYEAEQQAKKQPEQHPSGEMV